MIKGRKKKGFTLVELLVVIAIIAILASVSTVGYLGFVAKANLEADKQEASDLSRSLQYYLVNNEDLILDSPEAINEAIKISTDGKFDLDNYQLRSSNKGYNLWFNTETQQFEVLDSVKELERAYYENDNVTTLSNTYKPNSYSSIAAFLWEENRPYMLMSSKGSKLADLIYTLRTSEDLSHISLKGIEDEYANILKNALIITRDGNSVDLNEINADSNVKKREQTILEPVKKDKVFFADSVSTIKEVGRYEIKDVTLPSSVKQLEAGSFYDAKLNNLNINHKGMTIKTDAVNPLTNIVVDCSIDIKNKDDIQFEYSSKETNIKQCSGDYKWHASEIKKASGEKIVDTNNPSEEDLVNVNKWTKEVTKLYDAIEANFDIYSQKDHEQVLSVISLDQKFNKMKEWERNYIENNLNSTFKLFYNETKDETKIILSKETGIFNRFETYEAISQIILDSELWQSLGEEDIQFNNVELVSYFNDILINDTYDVLLTDESDSINEIYFDNLINVNQDSATILQNIGGGHLINLGYPGKDNIKLIMRSTGDEINRLYKTEYGVRSLVAAKPSKTERQFIGNQNDFVIGVEVVGTLNSVIQDNEFKVTIAGQPIEFSFASKSNNAYVLKIKKLNMAVNNDYDIKISVKGKSVDFKIRLIEGSNINSGEDLVKNFARGTYLLNTSISFQEAKDEYVLKNGELYSNSQIKSLDKKIKFKDATILANNYTIDASKVNEENPNTNNKSIIELNNSTIENLNSILANPRGYTPSAEFNVAAQHIYTTGNTVIKNSTFTGGSRGIRVDSSNMTIENVEFNSAMVAIEIYANGTRPSTKRNINVKNVNVNSHIEQSNTKLPSNGMGIVFFPGGSGAGIKNFDMINLVATNFNYDGVFDKTQMSSLLTSIISGLASELESMKEIIDWIADFEAQLNELYQGKEKICPNIIVPTRLYASLKIKDIIPDTKFNEIEKWSPTINIENDGQLQSANISYKDVNKSIRLGIGIFSTEVGAFNFRIFLDESKSK